MDAAFDRLTDVQKVNVNKQMFADAYKLVTSCSGADLHVLIQEATADCPQLRGDLTRYCRLVQKVL